MKIKGWDLKFFNTGEWQVCDERLKDLEKVNRRVGREGYNPGRANLFRSLRLSPREGVRVAIIGQDPYPKSELATGLAFDVPSTCAPGQFPQTLNTLFKEYCSDLGHDLPSNGNLEQWAGSGVLLWNAIPTCLTGKSMSHDWPEWECLTREIVEQLSQRGIVFALLGQVARRFDKFISLSNNKVITVSHPSPRGSVGAKTPFLGSRLFSTINAKLVENAQEPIDWKLP